MLHRRTHDELTGLAAQVSDFLSQVVLSGLVWVVALECRAPGRSDRACVFEPCIILSTNNSITLRAQSGFEMALRASVLGSSFLLRQPSRKACKFFASFAVPTVFESAACQSHALLVCISAGCIGVAFFGAARLAGAFFGAAFSFASTTVGSFSVESDKVLITAQPEASISEYRFA